MPKARILSVMGLVLLIAIPVAVLALPGGKYEGKPVFSAGSERGYFVWHDDGGWHVRVTTKGATHRFHGNICTGGVAKIKDLVEIRDEAEDSITLGPKEECLHFKLINHGAIDGFDFRTAAQNLIFDFKIDDKAIGLEHIFVGKDSVHPKNNPFKMDR